MIHGIGTDIVEVARIERALAQHGERFALRILADSEFVMFQDAAQPVHFLAKRFAAKEAGAKALGTGFADGVTLKQLVVRSDERGRPILEMRGRADELCREFGIADIHLSLADERAYAVAFVTLVRA
ncbi:MAG: holo-ACP synthase [Gammaproteobacteria bacterium]|nr:holo-ACP synthase [Gammaproteobacteria bacterium]MCP5137129.1 holo-ACP synthase [Gammaproteobacteria bacterium]